MYATFSYDVTTGARPVDEVRNTILQVFAELDTCDLLADTLICRVDSTTHYLDLVRALKQISSTFGDQFLFVFTLHDAGAALRSNAPIPARRINDIIKDGD